MPGHGVWSHSLRTTLLLMAPFDLLASLAMDAYLPIVPRMPEALGTTPATIQLTLGLYLLVLGCGQLVFGPLSDRFGRRPVLLAGAWLFAGASAALASTSSALAFLVLRVLQAAGGAASLVATFATVRDVYAARPESTRLYSLLGTILAVVPAFGPSLGAAIDRCLGWRGIFLSLALFAVLAALQGFLRWPETRSSECRHVRVAHVLQIVANVPFWIYTLGFSTAMGAFFVYFSTAPLVLINRAGLNPVAFSLVFGTVALVMMATSRFVGRLAARWGEVGCLIRGMTFLASGAALLAADEILAFPSLLGFIGPMWLIAAGITLSCAVTANGALRSFGHAAGTATAIYSCLESVIVSCAGTLSVTLLPPDTAWPLAAFCGMASLLTIVLARRYLLGKEAS
jgi:MFS transporter, DHA1 family, chloramphenicol/florfenicol resistance protein